IEHPGRAPDRRAAVESRSAGSLGTRSCRLLSGYLAGCRCSSLLGRVLRCRLGRLARLDGLKEIRGPLPQRSNAGGIGPLVGDIPSEAGDPILEVRSSLVEDIT